MKPTLTETERIVALLASRAQTRVVLKGEGPPGVSGMYVPQEDRIFLFPAAVEAFNVNPVAVALEEAGHSRMRDEYLQHLRLLREWKTMTRDSGADHWLDWLEDVRIYRMMWKEYPGAREHLASVWQQRLSRAKRARRYWQNRARTCPDSRVFVRLAAISRIDAEIAERYLANLWSLGPCSFREAYEQARALYDHLEKTIEEEQDVIRSLHEDGHDQGDEDQGERGDLVCGVVSGETSWDMRDGREPQADHGGGISVILSEDVWSTDGLGILGSGNLGSAPGLPSPEGWMIIDVQEMIIRTGE